MVERFAQRKAVSQPVPPLMVSQDPKNYLKDGRLTERTDAVIAFASNHPGKSPQAVMDIMDELFRFKRERLSRAEMESSYGKKTADDILKTRNRCVEEGRGRRKYQGLCGLWECLVRGS